MKIIGDMFCARTVVSISVAVWVLLASAPVFGVLVSASENDDKAEPSHVVPLMRAHAHNDFQHKRPLLDALDCGFCSIEADIFLRNGQLLVGHVPAELRPERTLEKLYLDLLRERVKANGGRVFAGGPTITLLIDVKTEAKETYAALHSVLERYADFLSITCDGKLEVKAVTVVVSGNRAREAMTAQAVRYASIDGRLADLDSTAPSQLIPWISDSWTTAFKWRGEGPMPNDERDKLREIVRKAHLHGRRVRFWATPEKVSVWKELLAADVDLIGADRLNELQQFLLPHELRGQ